MSPVWLVRHGEAAASWGEHHDPGLSELGKAQAESAAELLHGVLPPATKLVSSPKQRALDTAQPLASRLNCDVVVDVAFREIDAPVPLPERQNWLRGFMQQTWTEQDAALWRWREDMVAALQALQTPTVVFTHFLVINTVVAHCQGATATLQCWPDNGSVHEFEARPSTLRLVNLGQQMSTVVN